MKVLLVGHCMPDRFMLTSAVKHALPEATTERVNSDRGLEKHLPGAALLLVNRVLDGRFDAPDGVALIGALAADRNGDGPALMLISNFPEAQEAAVEAGAAPGIGKSGMRSDEAAQRLRDAVGA